MRRNAPLILIPVVVGIVVLVVIAVSLSRSSRSDAVAEARVEVPKPAPVVAALPSPSRGGSSLAGAPTAPEAPEPTAETAAAEPPKAPEPAPVDLNAPGTLSLVVLEETTKAPLSQVKVVLAAEEDPSTPLHDLRTDSRGAVVLRGVAPGSYTTKLQWGWGPQADGGIVTIQPAEQTNHLAEYPGRVPLRFQLVDEEDQPVANQPLKVGMSLFEETDPAAHHVEDVRTAADGTFTVMGYDGVRTHLIASEEPILFSAPRGRGGWRGGGPIGRGMWSNPYVEARPVTSEAEEPTRVVARLNQVNAIGRIENAPEFERGQGFAAMVQGRGVMQMYIPVNSDNEVRFTAPPSTDVTITLFRTRLAWSGEKADTSAMGGGEGWGGPNAELMRSFAGTFGGISREHIHTVTMPDEPGQFVFQMELQDRVEVAGVVYGPDGEPASGIEVLARGARGEGGEDGRGGPFMDGRSMFRAKKTDSDGRFTLELTESPEYTFLIEQRTLPEDARSFDYPTLAWQEIVEGEEVTLNLGYSALVWGEVVDESGSPVPGLTVRLGGTDISRAARAVTATTDSAGIFELNIPIGNFGQTEEEAREQAPPMYVYAVQRDHATGFSPAELNSIDPVRVIMYTDTEVVIRATADGQPLQSIQVAPRFALPELGWMGGGGRPRRVTSEDGIFVLGKYPRGVTTLNISRGGRGGERVTIGNDAGELLDVLVDLSGSEAGNEGGERGPRGDGGGRRPGDGAPPPAGDGPPPSRGGPPPPG